MISAETYNALKVYATETNAFLDFVRREYPDLSEVESAYLATLTLRKIRILLSSSNFKEKEELVNELSRKNN